jgi:retinol dehydrogenase-14
LRGWAHESAALNHLAPFLLTNLLLDRLTASAPARVVTVSSGAEDQSALFRVLVPLMRPFMKTTAQGAATSIYVASSAEVEGVTGEYFVNSKRKKSARRSYDTAAASRLRQVSSDLVHLASESST